MVALAVVVRQELVDCVAQAPFPEENQPVETLFANGAHKPFRVGIGVRGVNRRLHDAHAGAF